MKFLDEASIFIRSGHGGAGSVSFRHEKFVPKGGPDGGDGGRGGNVLFAADQNLSTLIDFRYKRRYEALDGQKGQGQKKSGAHSPHIDIKVPVGTVIRDKETHELLADLTSHGQHYVALEGGRGGKGNFFFRSSTQQTPHHSQPGEPGKSRDILLELKLLADVGLIGYPNAGKSTLISRLSNAKPKIADYPFTTLTPNLGVVRVSDENSFVIADIPGLIKGAHTGTGLGIKFLKHIERTHLFLHLVDVAEMDRIERFETILDELRQFNDKLLKKKQFIVLTKTDLIHNKEDIQRAVTEFEKRGYPTFAISSVQGQGIQDLVYKIADTLKESGYHKEESW